MPKSVWCAWAGEYVEEHDDCICKTCAQCERNFRGNRFELVAYNSVWLHKKCVIDWLVDNSELMEDNGDG